MTNSAGILWTHDGSGSLVDATTTTPTYTPAAGDAGSVVTLTLTVSGSGSCADAVDLKEIQINPNPNFTITNNPSEPSTINNGEKTDIDIDILTPGGLVTLTDISLSAMSLTGYSAIGTIYPNGFKLEDVLDNNSNNPQWVEYEFTGSANGCINPVTQTARVFVNPAPEMTVTNNVPTICDDESTDIDISSVTANAVIELINVTISPNPVGVTGHTSVNTTWDVNLGQLPATISDALDNVTDTIQTITYEFEVSASGFTGTSTQTAVVMVNPTPSQTITNTNTTINSGAMTDILIETPTENGIVTLIDTLRTGDITGATSIGVSFVDGNSITDALVNNTTSPQTLSYVFRASANGCTNPETDTARVTINPAPEMTVTNNVPTICDDESTDIDISSVTANAVIELINVTISPNPVGVTGHTSVNTTWDVNLGQLPATISDALDNVTDTIQTITYEFEVSASGFTGTSTQTAVVMVNPTPSQTITNTNTTINSGAMTDILIETPTENGIVTLIDTLRTGDITGATSIGVSFVDGNSITDALVNNTTSPQTLSYVFRASANGCTNPETDTARVTINPAPEMTVTNNVPTICDDESTDIDISSVTANAVIELINVTISPNPVGVTGHTSVNTTWDVNLGQLPATISDALDNVTDTIQTITYEFEVSASGFTGTSTQTAVVMVNPTPSQTITNTNTTINSGAMTDILIETPTENGIVTLIDTLRTGDITGATSIGVSFVDGNSITDALVNNTTSPQTLSYVFRASANGCTNPETDTARVTINPAPEMTVTNNVPTICDDESTDIDISSVTANAVIELINVTISPNPVGVTGHTAVNTTWDVNLGQLPATISDALDNVTDTIQTITYEFEVSASGFTGTSTQTAVVTVNPTPSQTITNTNTTINSGAMTDILIETPTENGIVTLIDTLRTGDITGATSIGVSFVDGNSITDALVNNTTSPQTLSYVFRASANGCTNPETDTARVTINPAPEMTVTNNVPTICDDESTDIDISSVTANAVIELINVTISPNPVGVTGHTSVNTTWDVNLGQLPATISDALDNVTDTIQTITYEFEVSASGFTGTSTQTAVVMVNPTPSQTITNTNTTIINGAMTDILIETMTENGQVELLSISKTDPGITGNTSAGAIFTDGARLEDVLLNSTTSPQIITYEFQATANGCTNTSTVTADVTVVPSAQMTLINNAPILCSVENTNIELSSSTVGAVIELIGINTIPDNGSVTGMTPVTTTWNSFPSTISDNLVNATSATQTVEYIFEVSAGGFTNPVTQSVFVEVRPLPDINASAPAICSEDVTNIDIWNPNSVNFTVFNWVTLSTGAVTGASDGAGTKISQQLNNNSPGLDNVVYRIYATAQSCAGDSIDIVQDVYPRNIANAGTDTVVCQGTPVINIETASIGGSATLIDWTVLTGGGTITDPTNIVPSYNPDPVDEVGTISLQLTASDASVCPAVSDLVSIIINPTPVVSAGSDQVICEGDNALLSEAMISGSTTAVTWTDATGLGTFSPNANTLNAIFMPHTDQIGTSVKLYITTNDPAGPCIEARDSLIVTINEAPIVDAGLDKTICEADSAFLNDAVIGGTASSVVWSGGSGYFYPNNTTLNAYYVPDATETGSSVTLTLTTNDPDGSGPCVEVEDQVIVNIDKSAEVDAGAYPPMCETSVLNLNGSISGAATSATWSTSGDGTFSFVGNLNATYTPGPNDIASNGVTLTLTTNDPSGPCNAVSDDVFIQIDQAATVDAGTYAPICIGDTIFLSGTIGGSASSATWSGGIGTFNDETQLNTYYLPDALEQGSDVILTLTTDDPANSCFATSDLTLVTVNRLPLVGFSGLSARYQVDDPSVPLTGIPGGGIFSGPGIVGNTFSPSLADTGTHVVRYTYVDGPTGCSNFHDETTIVDPIPIGEVPNPGPYCLNENPTDPQNKFPRTTEPGFIDSWSGPFVFSQGGEYYFNIAAAGVAQHTVTYTIEEISTGAVSSEPRYIDIRDIPQVDFVTANNCIADTIQFVDLSTLANGSVFNDSIVAWEWEIGVGTEYLRVDQNPRIKFDETKPNDYYVRLTVTTEFGCSDFTTGEALIGAVPEAFFTVNNLTFGETSEFVDMTPIPNESEDFPDGYEDPTSSIDSIYWDFGEGSPVFGPYGAHNPEYHQYTQANQNYTAVMRIWTDLGCYSADTVFVSIIESIDTFPYEQPFESFNPFAFDGDNPSWQLTVPSGDVIQGEPGNNAWVTNNANGHHNDDEHSYVSLPAFDISGLTRPMISLDIWSNSENTRDGAVLQYSYNGGDWFTLVDPNENIATDPGRQIGLEWYNETGLVSNPGDGTIVTGNETTNGENERGYGWTGVDTEWRTARFPLDSVKNAPGNSIRFRVVFSSDQQNPEGTTYDGFAFDNLWIGDRTRNVLFEHFDNMNDGTANQIDSINYLSDRFALDLIPLQYHTNYPSADAIYQNNKYPVESRAAIYDINQSPRSFMDGITEYDYSGAYIKDYQIINRSLEDPLFDIDIMVSPPIDSSRINITVTITARDSIDDKVILHVMPIETGIYNSPAISLPQGIDSLNNVVKDKLGGWVYDMNWLRGDSKDTATHWDLNELLENNEIYDPTKLGLVVFVQNDVNEGSREVYQAVYTKLPILKKTVITGLEEELNIKRIEEANIYPNPAQNYFHVALSDQLTQDLEWKMVDQRGVELMHGTFESGEDSFDINTRNIPNGLHLFIVTGGDDYKAIRKIIIQR